MFNFFNKDCCCHCCEQKHQWGCEQKRPCCCEQKHHDCEQNNQCGCEQKRPCGCEQKRPCGCEQKRHDCEQRPQTHCCCRCCCRCCWEHRPQPRHYENCGYCKWDRAETIAEINPIDKCDRDRD